MTEKKLPVRTLLLWQIRVTVLFVLLGAVCLYFCSVYKWFWVLVTVITAVFLFVILWYLPRFIRNYRIKLIGEAVIIENGVFIKTTHIMPYSRMIYTKSFTTPLAKAIGLTSISLKAARSSIIMPEILVSDAVVLLKLLSKGGEE
ncbi:MAG: hypothetical protein U0L36_02185 [Acutalibacteraceae bacterium]|nr:hypothetical protein [Acutalibacteraceae bacterium]